MSDATPSPLEVRESDRLIIVPGGPRDARSTNNLPLQISSFVGREKELAEVKRLLENTRLLTLTGSGGCGKTRLALEVADELVEGFEEGVRMVELRVLATIREALGIPGEVAWPVPSIAPRPPASAGRRDQ